MSTTVDAQVGCTAGGSDEDWSTVYQTDASVECRQEAVGCVKPKTLSYIESHLSYLPDEQLSDVIFLLQPYPLLFSDVPSCTILLFHDIDVVSAAPIKQHACGCPLPKREMMIKGAKYLLENGSARPSPSPWSSLCFVCSKSL